MYTLSSVPHAEITMKKNRLKKSSYNLIYMESGSEFEIELENNTKYVWLAKIKLNGHYISNDGLILRPGEHVYLERYLDNDRKFKFETYSVSKRALASSAKYNGRVVVEFYKQNLPKQLSVTDFKQWYSTKTTSNDWESYLTVNRGITGSLHVKPEYINYIETGMVEKGSHSDQSLIHDDSFDFESYASHIIEYSILPMSRQIIDTSNKSQVQYCSNCGRKRKQKENFCPSCGKKW